MRLTEHGPAVCMECWGIYHRTMQENQRLSFAFMNYLEDQMAAAVGLPRLTQPIKIPMPSAPITMNTTNNIRVEAGSQVGQINAGALVYLDGAVTTFNSKGNRPFAAALQSFTQKVVDSKELSPESQKQILELLQVLVEQATKPKEQRNTSVAKLAFQNIGALVSAANFLTTHWDAIKQFFEHLIK
jgi:hypothetical protein